MKNYLLSILLLTYLFTSCTSDDLTSHDSHDNHKHLNEISFSEFKEKTNQKKFNPFAFNVDKNKRLNENLYFRVDTTVVKQNTLTNGKVNFTLRALSMQPESEDVFYNIIYYNKDEKWHWSILEIPNNFMTQEKTSIKEVLNSINGANNLINSKLVGTWVTTTSYHCNGEGKCATGECDGCNVCVSTSISYEYVDLPNTEEYYFVIAPTPGGGGGGGGMSAEQKALNSFINSLNIQQLNIFYNHPELAEYLLNNMVESPRFELINPGTGNGGIGIYDPNPTPQLPEYGFSQEAKDFVSELISVIIDYKYQFPNYDSNLLDEFLDDILNTNTEAEEEINLPTLAPSCESFNFEAVGTANWQSSLVKNIGFTIILLTPSNISVSNDINYPQPIEFGCPQTLLGGLQISPGRAANLSSQVLKNTINLVVRKFGNKKATNLMVKILFEKKLKDNYPLTIFGGRVNFNSTSNKIPTQYQTNALGTGNCD